MSTHVLALVDHQHPLHDACTRGDLARVRYFVEGAEPHDVNERGEPPQQWCPLHCAAVSGQTDIAKYLIQQRADVLARDADGWTALHMAASHGHGLLVQFLLESKADHALKDHDGFTALHEASRNARLDVVVLLLTAGASVNVRDVDGSVLRELYMQPSAFARAMETGRTALHWSAANGHTTVCEKLIEWGSTIDAADASGDTPFHLAACHGQITCAMAIAAAGADIKRVNHFGWSAIHHAAWNGHADAIAVLMKSLDLQHFLEQRDKAGHCPLHLAVLRGQIKAAQQLVMLGASSSPVGPCGYTPLHYAARQGLSEMFAALVRDGANELALDEDGLSAADLRRIEAISESDALFLSAPLQPSFNTTSPRYEMNSITDVGDQQHYGALMAHHPLATYQASWTSTGLLISRDWMQGYASLHAPHGLPFTPPTTNRVGSNAKSSREEAVGANSGVKRNMGYGGGGGEGLLQGSMHGASHPAAMAYAWPSQDTSATGKSRGMLGKARLPGVPGINGYGLHSMQSKGPLP